MPKREGGLADTQFGWFFAVFFPLCVRLYLFFLPGPWASDPPSSQGLVGGIRWAYRVQWRTLRTAQLGGAHVIAPPHYTFIKQISGGQW